MTEFLLQTPDFCHPCNPWLKLLISAYISAIRVISGSLSNFRLHLFSSVPSVSSVVELSSCRIEQLQDVIRQIARLRVLVIAQDGNRPSVIQVLEQASGRAGPASG